jgi:hypothetical protein
MFRRNMSPPSAEFNSKLSNKPAWSRQQANLHTRFFLCMLFDLENWGSAFLRNVGTCTGLHSFTSQNVTLHSHTCEKLKFYKLWANLNKDNFIFGALAMKWRKNPLSVSPCLSVHLSICNTREEQNGFSLNRIQESFTAIYTSILIKSEQHSRYLYRHMSFLGQSSVTQ